MTAARSSPSPVTGASWHALARRSGRPHDPEGRRRAGAGRPARARRRERGRARGRQAAGVVIGLDGRARVAAGQARPARQCQRRPRRGGKPLGRASRRRQRRRLRHRRLAHRRGAVGRLARRGARRDGGAGGPAHAGASRRSAAGRGPLGRLGRRGGRALRPQPRRLVARSPARSTPTTSAACATQAACGCRTRCASVGVDLDGACGRRPRAWTARAPTSSCTSSRAPSCSTAAAWPARSAGTFGDERYLIAFSGQSAHAGSTPMHLRRDTLAAAATAALEIREVGIRHGGVTTVGAITSSAGGDHRDRGGVGDDARPAPPRR